MMTVDGTRGLVQKLLPRGVKELDLEFYDSEIRQVDDHIVVGKDWGNEFRVDVATGAVCSVSTAGTPVRWFVNSGLREFAACLEVHDRVRELGAECAGDDHKWQAALHIMLADVKEIDPKATAAGGNWWPMLAESLMI
jgi:hypothetical protein